MSNYGMTKEKIRQMTEQKLDIQVSDFLSLKPWVLVPNGSLKGFFDWVPKHLRVGPWHPTAPITLLLVLFSLLHFRPMEQSYSETLLPSEHKETIMDDLLAYSYQLRVSSYPEAFSTYWWYNVTLFLFQNGLLLYIMIQRTPFVVVTYTILSWVMNGVRHGINALAPFLHDGHYLLHLNRVLRFPALSTASITFCVWNCILLPFVYNFGLDTAEKKRNFTKFNLSFRLSQQHLCMIVYSALNTLVAGPCTAVERNDTDNSTKVHLLFTHQDLWYGMTFGIMYGLFYSLILDRVGVHLYAVFSPRSKYVAVTWICAQGLYYMFYLLWNSAVLNEVLTMKSLLCINGVFMITTSLLYYKIFGLQ